MRTKNELDKWLKSPIVKKHLQHFTYRIPPNFEVYYDQARLVDIIFIMGCWELNISPYYHGMDPYKTNTVKRIKQLPQEEIDTIIKLFNYFEDECPKTKLKRLIKERDW